MTQDNGTHDLADFMRQVSVEMAAEYNRIQRRAKEDPGTAGDQGEENWASLLRDWLPSTYEVVTKGRIIGEDGRTSPQVDVVVLKDIYPKKLLDKKLYLAGGVAAAFECKTTLRPEHIEDAVKTGVRIKGLFPAQTGTPYQELQSQILYGLLAHSHDWKSPGSQPVGNVTDKLQRSDLSHVSHPRECLDLLCVADLDTWTLIKMTLLPLHVVNRMHELIYHVPSGPQYAKGAAWTSHLSHATQAADQGETFTPIGSLISSLTTKLAWGNPSLRALAEYYPKTGIDGAGGGTPRFWVPTSVYSQEVCALLPERMRSGLWDEWSNFFL